jgi:hypothetical protein
MPMARHSDPWHDSYVSDERHAAFYYPGVIWHDANWVKSLALFFDEIALLVPDYMRERLALLDPAIVAGLQDAGLLRILSPESLVDDSAAERLASALGDVLASGVLDELPHAGPFQELSWSRMGGLGDPELAQMIFEELRQRGLAEHSQDGASIPLHPLVRNLFLVLLAQILRESGPGLGVELSPATDSPRIQEALIQLLQAPSPQPAAGQVVKVDLEVVGPNLDAVPLDEVVQFRAEHGAEFRAYARRLRSVVREMAGVSPGEQSSVLDDRLGEIRDAGATLRQGPFKAIAGTTGIAIGIAGGVTSAAAGDPIGAILSAFSTAAGVATLPRKTITPYSYLFSIGQKFG